MPNRDTTWLLRRIVLLPLILVGVHTVLIVLAICIGAGPGWNDQSPIILLPMFINSVDWPVFQLLKHIDGRLGVMSDVLWLVLGAIYWFLIGLCLSGGWYLLTRHETDESPNPPLPRA